MGTVILTVTATDADSGNFALIEYSLGDGEGKFAINPTTVSRHTGRWEEPGQRLRSRHKYHIIPASGSSHRDVCGLRGFFTKSAGPAQVPDIRQTVALLSLWPQSFETSLCGTKKNSELCPHQTRKLDSSPGDCFWKPLKER